MERPFLPYSSVGRRRRATPQRSRAGVTVAILANRAIPGMSLIALGALSNLTAIIANGGFMPASPGALAALGRVESTGYSNSAVNPDAALAPLTDIFALPPWLPFTNVFSLGDVLIGLGVGLAYPRISRVLFYFSERLPSRRRPWAAGRLADDRSIRPSRRPGWRG